MLSKYEKQRVSAEMKIHPKEYVKEEARETADNLLGFFHLLYKIDQMENKKKNDAI